MALALADYETKACEAVQIFWSSRERAREKGRGPIRANGPGSLAGRTWMGFWPW